MMLSTRVVIGFLAETLRIAAPYSACALGGVVTERAGVINIALEGTLIVSGLASVVGTLTLGSPWLGFLSGVMAGAVFCLAHGALVVRGRVDAIVSGIALNIVAFGLARVVLRVLYSSASNSPTISGFSSVSGPSALAPLLRALANPVMLALVLAVVGVSWVLQKTKLGLRIRAVGESPGAARAVGIDGARTQLIAVTMSGAIAGLGGAHLVFDQHHFDASMSGGRGFIALAAVILGAWQPWKATLACLGFAALEAAQIALQEKARIPTELVQMLPYLATLAVLGWARRAQPPGRLGLAEEHQANLLRQAKQRDAPGALTRLAISPYLDTTMFDDFGINAGFVEEQYLRFLENPRFVHESWRAFFERFGQEGKASALNSHAGFANPSYRDESPSRAAPQGRNGGGTTGNGGSAADAAHARGISNNGQSKGDGAYARELVATAVPTSVVPVAVFAQAQVTNLVNVYRTRGHLYAYINPLQEAPRGRDELELRNFGLSEADLDKAFSTAGMSGPPTMTLREIVARLEETYCRTIGVEFMQIEEPEMRTWLQQSMEASRNRIVLSKDEQLRILTKLTDAEVLEQFIHKIYVGAKRFSLEGAESLIPLLDLLVEDAGAHGVEEIVMGMAHRGRLNVLCNILNKNVRELFAAFDDKNPERHLGSGDVKYHLGYSTDRQTVSGHSVHLSLAFNPSHLEWVNPVVEGRVRAKQDSRGDAHRHRVMPLLVHGDAAFMGQGVVAETLNLAGLEGYTTGGTIHVIVNNQIGFTTNPSDSRSTRYATDIARMLNVPVFHVNGEDPEAVVQVTRLAIEFRHRFSKDVIIDMYCYRKYGHNEQDEPRYTQPLMYTMIQKQSSVRQVYVRRLLEMGQITEGHAEQIAEQSRANLASALEETRRGNFSVLPDAMGGVWHQYCGGPERNVADVPTAISKDTLLALIQKLNKLPEDFQPFDKLAQLLRKQWQQATQGHIDWAAGEALALASLVAQGTSVRISGQDSRRGTFSHRHACLRDTRPGRRSYVPLASIAAEGKARFEVWDSPLSEAGVLGFEYGYSLDSPPALVCWEAQFGDFANSAQVIIDQFIVAGEDKWHRLSGLVLLLPHGYEGQGPEHSSARLERFLNNAAEDNIQVCNLTNSAQLFHVLRRQILRPWRKPLVIMTPKSLLRAPEAVSSLDELASGSFHRVLADEGERDPQKVSRILLCSGKVYYDLIKARTLRKAETIAVIRLEQLYPLHNELTQALAPYKEGTPLIWVQDEPWNTGAWFSLNSRLPFLLRNRFPLSCVSRAESASPATGSKGAHELEQRMLIDAAFAER